MQFQLLPMSRNLLSYLSGVILEVSLENRPLWVVILKRLALEFVFWKDRNVLSSSFFLSKCDHLYHINYWRVEGGGFILTLHSVLLGAFFALARAQLLREINLIISLFHKSINKTISQALVSWFYASLEELTLL